MSKFMEEFNNDGGTKAITYVVVISVVLATVSVICIVVATVLMVLK